MFILLKQYFLSQFCTIFILLLRYSSEAVQVECRTATGQGGNVCPVGLTTTASSIRLVWQYQGSNCHKDFNYVLIKNGFNSYVSVNYECFGMFEVTTPPSWTEWSYWGPCSISCGAGTRTRTRICSTGRDVDCFRLESTSEHIVCYLGPCKRETSPPPPPPLCGSSPLTYRILGGQDAYRCQFPWMVMIDNLRANIKCGGTIMDQTRIITAAHCVTRFDVKNNTVVQDPPANLIVYTGSSTMPMGGSQSSTIQGLVKRSVVKLKIHEQYVDSTLANDIAVITLAKPIVYDDCHVPVCMIDDTMSVYKASDCITMGWGRTKDVPTALESNQLKWTSIKVFSPEKCSYAYGKWFLPKCVCAGGNGPGACGGDSGGPLVCKGPGAKYYQHGIVSNGFGCGELPGQYTNIQEYLSWLQKL